VQRRRSRTIYRIAPRRLPNNGYDLANSPALPALVERRQPRFDALLVLRGISATDADRANCFTIDHDREAAADCSDVAETRPSG